ncbi:MAG: c-type cytochrome biogenesis protein CcmI [Pseudomonadota bacterium]
MIAFLICALALTLGAAALVVVPLWRGGADAARRQGAALGLAVMAVSAALYPVLGTPSGIGARAAPAPAELTRTEAVAMVERLAQEMLSEPGNAQGWLVLARAYTAMERYPDASDAYARLVKLAPPTARMLTDFAEVLALSQGKRLQGEPERLLIQAAELEPEYVEARVLLASAQFERGDHGAAIDSWRKVAALAPQDSPAARLAADAIADAGKRQVRPAPPEQVGGVPQEIGVPQVGGLLELDPALLARTSGEAKVFIFARAPQGRGPRFPLAVLERRVRDLPLRFTLDDTMSMAAGAKLSDHATLVVGARIAVNGSATPSPGDLEAVSAPVALGTADLRLRIASVVR